MKGDRERILAAGCDAYLSKPVDPRSLVQTVDRLLAHRRPSGQPVAPPSETHGTHTSRR
jgi:DNA-binding response OmpR family regulator